MATRLWPLVCMGQVVVCPPQPRTRVRVMVRFRVTVSYNKVMGTVRLRMGLDEG